MMKNSEQPITPCMMQQVGEETFRANKHNDPKEYNIPMIGLTKREYMASQALSGLLSIYENNEQNPIVPNEDNVKYMAKLAVKAADALLEELNK